VSDLHAACGERKKRPLALKSAQSSPMTNFDQIRHAGASVYILEQLGCIVEVLSMCFGNSAEQVVDTEEEPEQAFCCALQKESLPNWSAQPKPH
jgi:hypothetical protein